MKLLSRSTTIALVMGGVCLLLVSLAGAGSARAAHTPTPGMVTIAGSLQSELGCPGDWQPECANTALDYDSITQLWIAAFDLPAGNYEYKAALNGTWEENYGQGGVRNGPNIPLNLADPAQVIFFYDHDTHKVADTAGYPVVPLILPFAQGAGVTRITGGYNAVRYDKNTGTYYGHGDSGNLADLMALDIGANEGANVYAAADGTVWHKGNCSVTIRQTEYDVFTSYLHITPDEFLEQGATVTQGVTVLGKVATSGPGCGKITGPHLHFMLNKWVGIGEPNPQFPSGSSWKALPFLDLCGKSYPYKDTSTFQYEGTQLTLCLSKYEYISQNVPSEPLDRGETFVNLSFTLKNISGSSWSTANLRLGTESPKDRPSPFYREGNAGWSSNNRILPRPDTGPEVPNNGVVTFQATLTAPTTPGTYREKFRLVSDGDDDRRYAGEELWFEVIVCDPGWDYCDVDPEVNVFYDNIACMTDREIFNGYTDGLFRPDANLLRGHMALIVERWLKRVLPFEEGEPPLPEPHDPPLFADVNVRDHPEYLVKAVEFLAVKGVISGSIIDGQLVYRPDDPISRGEATKIIVNAALLARSKRLPIPGGDLNGLTDIPVAGNPFPDAGGTFEPWIVRAQYIGLAHGFSDGNFWPDRLITRGAAAKLIHRAIVYVNEAGTNDSYQLPGKDEKLPCPTLSPNATRAHSDASDTPGDNPINTSGDEQVCFPYGSSSPIAGMPNPEHGSLMCYALANDTYRVVTDVAPEHSARREIEAMFEAGLTTGCNQAGTQYCPNDVLPRWQIAIFLLRAKHYYETCQQGACDLGTNYTPPPAGPDIFADVSSNPSDEDYHPQAAWINELYRQGITIGTSACAPLGTSQLYYCPDDPVTRATMAIFLLRAREGAAYIEDLPPALGIFEDVDMDDHPWIEVYEDLYWQGITRGAHSDDCDDSGLRYCPADVVTRATAAVFFSRTFISPPTPTARRGDICFSTSSGFDIPRSAADSIEVEDEDIVCYYEASNQFKMYFNGSKHGLADEEDIDALAIPQDGEIWFSVSSSATIPGLGTVEDGDIIRYENDDFDLVLDSSDYDDLNDEDIDAFHYWSSQKYYLSSTAAMGGIEDEDAAAFVPSSGTLAMFLDLSDLQLEDDLTGISVFDNDPQDAVVYFSLDSSFCIPLEDGSFCGDGGDVLQYTGPTGPDTSGDVGVSFCFSMDNYAWLENEEIDALDISGEIDCGPPSPLPSPPPPPAPPPPDFVLHVDPAALHFTGMEMNPNPAPDFIYITNNGASQEPMHWTAINGESWLNLSQYNGVAPAVITATVNLDPLMAGVYSDTITITSPEAPDQVSLVSVSLAVSPPPASRPITLTAESGHTTVQLTWNPTNDPYLLEFRISRAISGTADFTPIASTTDTLYFDQDESLAPGTAYCYRIEAIRRNGSIATTSNIACAPIYLLNLWASGGNTAPGAVTTVAVGIGNAHSLQIAAADIWLDFDPSVLLLLGVSPTPLTNGYAWSYGFANGNDGLMRVKIGTLSTSPPILYGDGALFELRFLATGVGGESSPLDLIAYAQFVGGSKIYAADDLFTPIPLSLTDGDMQIRADNAFSRGDVNGDGALDLLDSGLALDMSLGELAPTDEQLQAGDVNTDGSVDAEDAALIQYYALHDEWPALDSQAGAIVPHNPTPTLLSLPAVTVRPSKPFELTLQVSNVVGLAGGTVVVAYDPSLVADVQDVESTYLTEAFDVSFVDDGAGLLSLSFVSDAAVSGSGPLFTITLAVETGVPAGRAAPLHIATAHLADSLGRDLEYSALQQPIVTLDGALEVEDAPSPHLSAAELRFSAAPYPTSRAIIISNAGTGVLDWEASVSAEWLTLSRLSGTAPSFVNLSADASGLASGDHWGLVVVHPTDNPEQTAELVVIMSVPKHTMFLPILSRP